MCRPPYLQEYPGCTKAGGQTLLDWIGDPTSTMLLSLCSIWRTLLICCFPPLVVVLQREQGGFDDALRNKNELEAKALRCETQLTNAGRLLGGLGGEGE